jgi:hypothetical protein
MFAAAKMPGGSGVPGGKGMHRGSTTARVVRCEVQVVKFTCLQLNCKDASTLSPQP